VRLNLGCADRYQPGWVNVDFQTPHRVDERVDLTGPLPEHWRSAVTHVYAGHLFEHLTRDDCFGLCEQLLWCAHSEGCVLVAVGPDVPLAEQMIADGTFDWSWGTLEAIKHGAGRWAGDVHQWETSGPLVEKLLLEAGWPRVWDLGLDRIEGGWPIVDPNQRWQYVVRAYAGRFTS
jgi:hypothetical protein